MCGNRRKLFCLLKRNDIKIQSNCPVGPAKTTSTSLPCVFIIGIFQHSVSLHIWSGSPNVTKVNETSSDVLDVGRWAHGLDFEVACYWYPVFSAFVSLAVLCCCCYLESPLSVLRS